MSVSHGRYGFIFGVHVCVHAYNYVGRVVSFTGLGSQVCVCVCVSSTV